MKNPAENLSVDWKEVERSYVLGQNDLIRQVLKREDPGRE